MNSKTHNTRAEVAVVTCEGYADPDRVYRRLKVLLDHLGGTEKFVRRGEKVLIKPNLLAADEPDKAVTSHPSVVAGMVRLVKEAGGVPLIGDSPSVQKLESVAGPTGMAEVAREYGATLVGLSTPTEVSFPDGVIMKRVVVAGEALEADAIISVSKLKTHGFTGFTGAVKNMFGVVPGLLKGEYHLRLSRLEDFSKMLVDVYAAVPARLHVMDAVWAMDGEKGPRAGRRRRVGLLIAGSDGVAVDTVACCVVGIKPHSIPTTRIGHTEGRGVGGLEHIEVRGEALEHVRVPHFEEAKRPIGISDRLPPLLFRFLRDYVSNKPRINRSSCKLCMTCYKACPPQAIHRRNKDGRLRIDYNTCIRCYCCLESCPYDAVEIKEGLLTKVRRWRKSLGSLWKRSDGG